MERSCESVTEGLRRRGHAVLVLTSRYQREKCPRTSGVDRRLHLEMSLAPFRPALDSFFFHRANLRRDREVLGQTIQIFAPDVVFVWGMWNLPRILAADAEVITGGRVLYRFADYWPSLPSQLEEYWNQPGRFVLTRALRRSLRPLALSFQKTTESLQPAFPYTVFASQAVRSEMGNLGVRFSDGPVIYNGFDFSALASSDLRAKYATVSARRLLYLGRLAPEKGVHVAVEALGKLAEEEPDSDWSLTIAGSGSKSYSEELNRLGHRLRIQNRLSFTGEIPSDTVPDLFHKHSILVVPSVWAEPLPRSALEGMASGSVVVASRIGGIPEIIHEPRTGFLFSPGDSGALADCLRRIAAAPSDLEIVGTAARQKALKDFQMDTVLDRIESALKKACLRPMAARVESSVRL